MLDSWGRPSRLIVASAPSRLPVTTAVRAGSRCMSPSCRSGRVASAARGTPLARGRQVLAVPVLHEPVRDRHARGDDDPPVVQTLTELLPGDPERLGDLVTVEVDGGVAGAGGEPHHERRRKGPRLVAQV